MAQSQPSGIWQNLTKLKTPLPYDLINQLVRLYPEDTLQQILNNIFTRLFTGIICNYKRLETSQTCIHMETTESAMVRPYERTLTQRLKKEDFSGLLQKLLYYNNILVSTASQNQDIFNIYTYTL